MPPKNTCTTVIPCTNPFECMSVEMQNAFKTTQELQVGACDYCNNPAPLERYSGCIKHKACEMCHTDESRIRRRGGGGLCAAGKCKEKAASMPLLRDMVLEKAQSTLSVLQEQFADAITREMANVETLQTTLRETKEELRKLKAAAADKQEEALVEGNTVAVEPETQVDTQAAVVETTTAPEVEQQIQAPPPPKRSGKSKRKADYTSEEWEARKEARKARELKRVTELRKELSELRALSSAQREMLIELLGGVEAYEKLLPPLVEVVW